MKWHLIVDIANGIRATRSQRARQLLSMLQVLYFEQREKRFYKESFRFETPRGRSVRLAKS